MLTVMAIINPFLQRRRDIGSTMLLTLFYYEVMMPTNAIPGSVGTSPWKAVRQFGIEVLCITGNWPLCALGWGGFQMPMIVFSKSCGFMPHHPLHTTLLPLPQQMPAKGISGGGWTREHENQQQVEAVQWLQYGGAWENWGWEKCHQRLKYKGAQENR